MINRMVLQGRLAADPTLRQTQSGVSVASFCVCWSEKYKETEIQLFLDCTAWRGTGELVSKYFSKGKEIAVEGRLQTEKWTTDDGQNRSTIKMTVDKVHFCGPKQDNAGSYAQSGGIGADPSTDPFESLEPISDDELPF